jgi:hypothetical protein
VVSLTKVIVLGGKEIKCSKIKTDVKDKQLRLQLWGLLLHIQELTVCFPDTNV